MSALASLDRAVVSTATAYLLIHRSSAQELVARLRRLTDEVRQAEYDLSHEKRVKVDLDRPGHGLAQAAERLVAVWYSNDATRGLHEVERDLRTRLSLFFIDRSTAACREVGVEPRLRGVSTT